jgi:hypothetical protein
MRRLTLALAGMILLGAVATGAGLAAMGAAGPPAPVIPATPSHTDVPCGIPTLVTVPDDTPEVSYEGFTTTYGYYKVVATLTDQGGNFALEGTGYRTTSVAPYRAEHLTLVIEPCRDVSPAEPLPSEAAAEPEGEPAPAPQPPSGCYP